MGTAVWMAQTGCQRGELWQRGGTPATAPLAIPARRGALTRGCLSPGWWAGQSLPGTRTRAGSTRGCRGGTYSLPGRLRAAGRRRVKILCKNCGLEQWHAPPHVPVTQPGCRNGGAGGAPSCTTRGAAVPSAVTAATSWRRASSNSGIWWPGSRCRSPMMAQAKLGAELRRRERARAAPRSAGGGRLVAAGGLHHQRRPLAAPATPHLSSKPRRPSKSALEVGPAGSATEACTMPALPVLTARAIARPTQQPLLGRTARSGVKDWP